MGNEYWLQDTGCEEFIWDHDPVVARGDTIAKDHTIVHVISYSEYEKEKARADRYESMALKFAEEIKVLGKDMDRLEKQIEIARKALDSFFVRSDDVGRITGKAISEIEALNEK